MKAIPYKRGTSDRAAALNACKQSRINAQSSCTGNERWVPHGPDFLWRLVALIHSMRLSLMKGAHADLSSTAWQEIGIKPGFGLSGIRQHSTRLFGSFRRGCGFIDFSREVIELSTNLSSRPEGPAVSLPILWEN
jgi:hypothetical protein